MAVKKTTKTKMKAVKEKAIPYFELDDLDQSLKWNYYECLELLRSIVTARGDYKDDYVKWAISACSTIIQAAREQK